MKLTDNFSLEEFERSSVAANLGIDNSLPSNLLSNVRRTAYLLQSLRNFLNEKMPLDGAQRGIYISSGYRSKALNSALGGARGSRHTLALAADISATGLSAGELFEFIKGSRDALPPFHKVILEFDRWVHVSVPNLLEKPSNRFLIASKKSFGPGIQKTVYEEVTV